MNHFQGQQAPVNPAISTGTCAVADTSHQPCTGSVGAVHKAHKHWAEVSLWQEQKGGAAFRGGHKVW